MAGSERLVDYFVVAAFDRSPSGHAARKKSGHAPGGNGKIVQRFPTQDWKDVPFIGGLELFCQPNGWHLYPSNFEPKFFVSGLTDEYGRRLYCACLTFGEAVEKASLDTKSEGDDDEDGSADYRAVMNNNTAAANKTNSLLRHASQQSPAMASLGFAASDTVMYAPKCLALISRHNYPEVLRNVLCVIYTAYADSMLGIGSEMIKIENLVGHLLGSVRVPAEGQSHTYFSLGGTDKILLQPPVHEKIPRTGQQVAQLFCQLGIKNVVQLLMAALTEQKILFFSRSFSRLTDGCLGLNALMYPMSYSHVFIPILPSSLVEVLSTPTPFIIGLHSNYRHDRNVEELLDVIFVDLDGGCIKIPDNFTVHTANESLLNNLYHELCLVFKPDLEAADMAFAPTPSSPVAGSGETAAAKSIAHKKSLFSLDKHLRAVMLRFFVIVLDGYRSCLTIVRIHPECNMTFHKAAFLGLHDPDDYTFLQKFLDSQAFEIFVTQRGPPWRKCDIYDTLSALVKTMVTMSGGAALSPGSEMEYQKNQTISSQITELANRLHENEDPSLNMSHLQYQHLPTPAAGTSVFARKSGHGGVNGGRHFPVLDDGIISTIINDAQSRLMTSTASPQTNRQANTNDKSCHKVVPMSRVSFEPNLPNMSNSARRLLVLRRCIYLIFDNKIAEARKTFPAVLSALKSRQARLALCSELLKYKEERHVGNQVVLEHQQFEMVTLLMNAALQDDSDMDECGIAYKLMPLGSVFCRQLASQVKQYLYTLVQEHAVWNNQQFWEASFYCDLQKGIETLYHDSQTNPENARLTPGHCDDANKEFVFLNNNEKVLGIAAREMELWNTRDKATRSQMCENEEKVIFTQLLEYCSNHIINYLCPMETDKTGKRFDDSHFESHSNSISNSVAESDSIDGESGFEEGIGRDSQETKEQVVVKFVLRFADKICSEARMSEDRSTMINSMIKGAVPMHISNLELVAAQSSKLPAILKPKIVIPPLLPKEDLLTPTGLRCYLISDGRKSDQLQLLPAEGAIFLTNYRIIFRGWPKHVYGCETAITRFFPVSSLTKEKKFSINSYLMEIEQQVKEGLQLRSNTSQLIKIAFDDDVHDQEIENFRKSINQIRYPEHISHVFAFKSGAADLTGVHGIRARKKSNSKHKTIRGLANKTMKTVSRAAHFGDGVVSKAPGHFGRLPTQMETIGEQPPNFNPNAVTNTPGGGGASATSRFTLSHSSKNTIEQYKKTSYYRDWLRLGLVQTNEGSSRSNHHPSNQWVKATKINQMYSIVPSYPGLFLVPQSLGEENLKRYGRFHKQSRVPTITWKHHKNSSLLLRGSSFQGRGVIGVMRRPYEGSAGPSAIADPTAVEADLFFTSLIRASQLFSSAAGMRSEYGEFMSGHSTLTPQTTKRIGAILQSTTQNLTLSRLTGLGSKMTRNLGGGSQQSLTSLSKDSSDRASYIEKASMYIFVQPQVRSLRIDQTNHRVELIPIDVPDTRRLKNSFKKLMRACLPSSPSGSGSQGQSQGHADSFYKAVDESEWLQGLQTLLHINDAVIDLMDIEKSSVMICLEDGWDVTAQISSIAQLCMDPFYRTLKGFRVLVEKEWLAMGHKFQHRSNLTVAGQDAAFAPIFLQFLDIVHQILNQFPMAFEFNQFYLRYLAYHHVSCRFNTFVFDNERLRIQSGYNMSADSSSGAAGASGVSDGKTSGDASDDDGSTTISNTTLVSGSSDDSGSGGTDVFDYIETAHAKSPIFFNFDYAPGQYGVLRPNSKLIDLDVWDYYYTEELNMGPVGYEFDLSHYEGAFAFEDITGQLAGSHSENLLIASYDWIPGRDVPHSFDLLAQIAALESQLGHVPKPWSYYWTQAQVLYQEQELPDEVYEFESLPVVMQSPRCLLGSATTSGGGFQNLHKPFTVEALMRGRNLAPSANSSYGVQHKYERYSYTTLTTCDFCNGLLWGPRTGVRCVECNYNCHQKCQESAPKTCSGYSQMPGQADDARMSVMSVTSGVSGGERPSRISATSLASSGGRGGGGGPAGAIGGPAGMVNAADSGESGDDASNYPYPPEESQIVYQGYLYKQANFKIKGWKLRWFVLDEMRHQIRYYDTRDDYRCKGTIELSDVMEVAECPSVPNAPKKAHETCFFEIKTSRRTFVFCSDTKQSAQEWISKIQFRIQ